jgi:outer membrane lipoprotein SlyB
MKKLMLFMSVVLIAGCASTPRRTETTYFQSSNPQSVYYAQNAPTTQQEQNRKILMQGVTGAAVGAIAAEASGGKAGTGALVGAGTNVIGGALIDTLTAPRPAAQPVYVQSNQGYVSGAPQQKKILRKYDSDGKIVSEEEVWE